MKSMFKYYILALLVVFSVSCTPSPDFNNDSNAVQKERLAYVQNHPGGKYNKEILDEKVAKGMNFDEVIASWGVPNVRREIEDTGYEHWIYAEKDSDTGLWRIINLAFKQEVLVYWDTNEGVDVGEGEQLDFNKLPTLSPDKFQQENTDVTPIKKGRQ